MTKPLSPHLIGLPLAPAEHVTDESQKILLNNFIADTSVSDILEKETLVDEYRNTYFEWILSTKNNIVRGLELFEEKNYSLGTSESFDKFYIKNFNKKFKCFRGDYLYHSISWKSAGMDWEYVDKEPTKICLQPGDAVVISLPFADTGNRHPLMNKDFLDECFRLKVPVMLDCAYFGICQDIEFDFTHPAITDISFSLSKSFPVRHFRIGLRLSKEIKDDGLTAYNNSQYLNKLACYLGIKFMNSFSPDYPSDTYKQHQIKLCKEFDLVPSNTVIFGLDMSSKYEKYHRGYPYSNRICFSKYLKVGQIPPNII